MEGGGLEFVLIALIGRWVPGGWMRWIAVGAVEIAATVGVSLVVARSCRRLGMPVRIGDLIGLLAAIGLQGVLSFGDVPIP
jgi:hypothetical protein